VKKQLYVFLACAVAASGLYAASAFDAAATGTRTVTASVVGDAAAYLAVSANVSSPHAGFVSTSGGKIVMAFGSGVATGTGVNPESTYYFDNILNLTNQGTKTVNVWVNATSTTGTVKACVLAAGATMDSGCYAAASSAVSTAVGARLQMGIMVQANSVASGGTVAGTIEIFAGR
jgi:hypothetical protein